MDNSPIAKAVVIAGGQAALELALMLIRGDPPSPSAGDRFEGWVGHACASRGGGYGTFFFLTV